MIRNIMNKSLVYQPVHDIEMGLTQLEKEHQMVYRWQNINFRVPVPKSTVPEHALSILDQSNEAEAPLNHQLYRESDPKYSKENGRYYKQILTNVSGKARPGEMIAIMGPSGGGKTSLLNFLAQRQVLSPGCQFDGDVTANGRPVGRKDFGKFGAFVQQDDVQIESMTPYECLMFAARMRTSLSPEQREKKV